MELIPVYSVTNIITFLQVSELIKISVSSSKSLCSKLRGSGGMLLQRMFGLYQIGRILSLNHWIREVTWKKWHFWCIHSMKCYSKHDDSWKIHKNQYIGMRKVPRIIPVRISEKCGIFFMKRHVSCGISCYGYIRKCHIFTKEQLAFCIKMMQQYALTYIIQEL